MRLVVELAHGFGGPSSTCRNRPSGVYSSRPVMSVALVVGAALVQQRVQLGVSKGTSDWL